MQLRNEGQTYPNVYELLLNPVETILQPGKRTTIWTKSQIYGDNEATGSIQSSPLLENDEDLLICPAFLSIQKKQTNGPNYQFSGQPVHTQEINAYSEFLHIYSRTNKIYSSSQSHLSEAPFEKQP